ncbi:MAG: hypothetical protein AW07_01465 [Candidatus Accumulibacter sp. SK-11]|nr:MAG: hypothetical protein AW07_01465 [Candidatus Accumulibacter sp. SK-11]
MLEACRPLGERARVVASKCKGAAYHQTRLRRAPPEGGRTRQHAAGKDVLLDEVGAPAVAREELVTDGDALDDGTAIGCQQALERRKVRRPPAFADRLEHLDRDDVIELLRAEVSVVAELDSRLVGNARHLQAFARELGLRRRQRQADDLQTGFTGSDFGEATPAAADLEDALARTRLQKLQDAPVLGELRPGQRAWRVVRVERARVTHRRIEPQTIEIVAEVVVRHDVAP